MTRHNYYRKKHQVGNLKRDPQLEGIADRAAAIMKKTSNWYFTEETLNGDFIGQNLFFSWGINDGNGIVDMWYKDGANYNYRNQGWNSETAGFTQLVWKATTKIGCSAGCNGSECFGLCVYHPAGNWGDFTKNVFPSK